MQIITINNCDCTIQAYLKDDFVNLWSRDEKGNPRGIITINFKSRKVEITRNKKEWVEFISGFDVDAIEIKLKELYL